MLTQDMQFILQRFLNAFLNQSVKFFDLADALYRLIFRGGNIGANIINIQNFEAYIADDDVKDNLY